MATLASHLLVGALIGAAVGLRLRWWPLAALVAELPDLDHLGALIPRATFHNVFAGALIPVAVILALMPRLERAAEDSRRLALATPALLLSHLWADLIPHFTEESGTKVALLYPLSHETFHFTPRAGIAVDPYGASNFTFLLAGLLLLVLGTRGMIALLDARAPRPARRRAGGAAIAIALVIMVPAFLVADVIAVSSPRPAAEIEIRDLRYDAATRSLRANVTLVDGPDVQPWALVLRAGENDQARNSSNPDWITSGRPWAARIQLPAPSLTSELRVELIARDGTVYASATLSSSSP